MTFAVPDNAVCLVQGKLLQGQSLLLYPFGGGLEPSESSLARGRFEHSLRSYSGYLLTCSQGTCGDLPGRPMRVPAPANPAWSYC